MFASSKALATVKLADILPELSPEAQQEVAAVINRQAESNRCCNMDSIDTEIIKAFSKLTEEEKKNIIYLIKALAKPTVKKENAADERDVKQAVYVWNKSPVMKMIGRNTQSAFLCHPETKEVFDLFREMPELKGSILPTIMYDNIVIDLLYSMYTLGLIHGIRQERGRRAGRRQYNE